MLKHGYIQIYTGDGKGKTTASLGLALRALGHGWKVLIIQFTKGDSATSYGEIVCRCETVTLGEIEDAITRNPKAITIDGVKHRVRAGMGRCL